MSLIPSVDGDSKDDEIISIDKLVAQYFQQVEPQLLDFPDGRTLINSSTQAAIYNRMFNEAAAWPIPPVNYRTRVLKIILSRLEESISDPEEDEISNDLMESWSELVSQPKPSALQQAQQLAYIKYTAPSDADGAHRSTRTVITSESRGLILSAGTTGFRTWEAALHLGSFLSTPAGASLVRGKRIVELGAGTGFLAMFCARHLDVRSVVATDRDPALIQNIQACLPLNNLDPSVFFPAIWDWGTSFPSAAQTATPVAFDVALGADLIYDTDLIPLLISTIRDLFDTHHLQEFVISATLRNRDTFQSFLTACESNHFHVERLPYRSVSEDAQTGFFHSTCIPICTYRICKSTTSGGMRTSNE